MADTKGQEKGSGAQSAGTEQVPQANAAPSESDSTFESYQSVAETVGGVPSFRLVDNLIQGILVVLGTALGAVLGPAQLARFKGMGGLQGVLLGALIGLVASVILSGILFMIVGWVRTARKISRH